MTSATLRPDRAKARPAREVALGAHQRRRRRIFWPFVGPALLLYVLFLALPTVSAAVLSFTHWAGAGGTPQFNGVDSYRQLFGEQAFFDSLVNTLIFLVVGGVGTFVLAFLFTMVLREMRGNKIIRAVLFFPNIVAPVALGIFLGFVFKFNPTKQGLANFLVESVGLPSLKFLQPEHVSWVVVGALIWASAGFYITILMAAVDRIPAYLYEDADIAGASPWQKFRHVTLPLTWDVVGIAGVLWSIHAIKVFELVFVLAGPGTYSPPINTWSLGLYVYARSFGARGTPQFGVVCACGVVMIILVSLFVLALRRLMRREAIQY